MSATGDETHPSVRMQLLVDLMFEAVVKFGVKGQKDEAGNEIPRFATRKEAAEWVANYLDRRGFPSWALK